jgi:hypothetical protein
MTEETDRTLVAAQLREWDPAWAGDRAHGHEPRHSGALPRRLVELSRRRAQRRLHQLTSEGTRVNIRSALDLWRRMIKS